MALLEEFKAYQGQFVIVGPNPRVAEVFRITELDQVFKIVGTLEEAIEYFGEKGGGNCT